MKKVLFFLALSAWLPAIAQIAEVAQPTYKKKIYFFADTTNMNTSNRVIEISQEGNIMKYFTIFCPCMDTENNFARFMWIKKKSDIMPKEVIGKPAYDYISFKELVERIAKYKGVFDYHYELNIVEPRKKPNQYIVWKVQIIPPQKPYY